MPTAKSATKNSATPATDVPVSGPIQPNLTPKLEKGDHVFLVDGSGYIFRAYHALPPLNRKSDGLQVNAVLGFCNMLWKLLADMKDDRPTHLAVIFDKSEKTFRTDFYPDYKAHRPDAPADLIPQFALIREAVSAFDIPCLEQQGFEADDLIATYARLATEAGARTSIVSSDKDLMQLVSPSVTMYDTMKDKRIGREEVIEKFGVPPEKVIDVQSLIGDSTDNVPGVPGIGVKTAAQLIGEYGDLETLLRRAGEIKQEKRRQTLIDNAEKARISKRLVTLDSNVPLDVPVEELAVHQPDYRKLVAFLKAMEFSTLTRRVAEAAGIDASQVEADARLVSGAVMNAVPPPHEVGGEVPTAPSGVHASVNPTRPASPATLPLAGGAMKTGKRSRELRRLHRSPPRGSKSCVRFRSTGASTKSSAASTVSGPGPRARSTSDMSPSIPRPTASIRCRRCCAASRSRSRPTRPATCRWRTEKAAAKGCSMPA
ncbi:MAG: hypothetical protein HXY30_03095 [Pseudorhodoplanes sp.]|nr:hypothetical protein [Pseudorhodoplanes sp.]